MKYTALLSASMVACGLLLSPRLQAQESTPVQTKPIGETEDLSFYNQGDPNIHKYWNFGTGLMYGLPLLEFKDQQYRNGLSLHAEVFSPSLLSDKSWLQFKLGAHIDGMYSGKETTNVVLQDPAGEIADYSIMNYSIGGHILGRLTTKEARVMPYLDGFIGGRWLASLEMIELDQEFDDYEDRISDVLAHDITFTLGASLGALVKVNDYAYLDFRVTYSHGSRSDFVNLESVAPIDDAVNFQINNTMTPLLFTQVGIVVQINGYPYYTGTNTNYDVYEDNNTSNLYRSRRRAASRNNDICAPRNRGEKSLKIKRNPKIKSPSKGSGSKS